MGNKTLEKLSPEELEKWKLFYDYSTEVYNSEEERYKRIEEKALSCLTAFSLLLVIYGFLWKHVLDNVIPPKCIAEAVLSVSSVVLLLFFILSWIITFHIFRTEKRKGLPLHKEMVEYFEKEELLRLYRGLGEISKEAYEENFKYNQNKVNSYKLGLRMIWISAISLMIFITMYATYLWCKCPLMF